jgi:hypothetical protein
MIPPATASVIISYTKESINNFAVPLPVAMVLQ